jgi:hypothetical protein
MTQKQKNPAGEGGALNCLAWRLDGPEYNATPNEIKGHLRLSRLQRWHGLTGSRAALVAGFLFDGGRAR